MLHQLQSGEEKVIAYDGRSLNQNEINNCITSKELLTVVYFTKYFRQYLLGRQFVVRTDHMALNLSCSDDALELMCDSCNDNLIGWPLDVPSPGPLA